MRLQTILPALCMGGLLLTACGNNENKTGEGTATDSLATVPADDFTIPTGDAAYKRLGPNEKEIISYLLGAYYSAGLLNGMEAKEKVKTDADVYTLYHYTDSICSAVSDEHMNDEKAKPQLYEVFDSVQTLFKKVQPLMPLIDLTCTAECTFVMILPDNAAWMKYASKTEGTHDDNYFKLVHTYYQGYNTVNTLGAIWFEGTWDYGGNSLLGDDSHYTILKMCQDIKKDSPFIKEIEALEKTCLGDALEWKTLKFTTEKAIEELRKIEKLDVGAKNKKAFDERYKQLNNPAKYEIQVDCEHKDCAYG